MTFSCLNLSPGPAQARWPQARTRPKPELYNKSGPVPGPARKVPGPSPAQPMDEVNIPGNRAWPQAKARSMQGSTMYDIIFCTLHIPDGASSAFS